jgi:hypothetical protein
VTLREVRWTEDLSVSGKMIVTDGPPRTAAAQVDVSGENHLAGHLEIRWDDTAADALAQIHGSIGGATVSASSPAP